ncbi:carbohydrate ABC transporter permease [Microbacterium sp. T2.11-28]|uniref:carbohydrate ABC transporter permease n=1 Tax=unclassified Microbacterium TaxID=2609290 RepID=UPI0024773BB2|nr:carbohydrate ABC transporter permease [Microbacterium sp. T2.11-28]CAI9389391.1 L-arabinose transport system permease protein AraQ [Microbacterium sp. T2.11-28]
MSATFTPKQRATRRRFFRSALWYVAVVLVSISTVLPLVWTLSTSLKPESEVLSGALEIIPRSPTFDNYVALFADGTFGRYLVNSFVLAVGGTLTNVFFGSLAGYALAKLRFPGRSSVFATFLASMMVPAIVTMIPTFLVLRYFPLAGGNDLLGQGGVGMINSYAAVLVPFAAGAFAVFFMKQFFESLPDEIGDAARIDGAGEFRIFLSVYFPLSTAGAAVLAVLTFQAGWNSFLWPLIALNNPEMYTVQIGLSAFINEYETDYGPLMAGTIVASLPVLLVFVLAQKYIVQNFTGSAVK